MGTLHYSVIPAALEARKEGGGGGGTGTSGGMMEIKFFKPKILYRPPTSPLAAHPPRTHVPQWALTMTGSETRYSSFCYLSLGSWQADREAGLARRD